MNKNIFTNLVSASIWETKYRYCRNGEVVDATIEDTWHRIADALSSVEAKNRENWQKEFFDALTDFRFLPGGRIQAGAGTPSNVTLFNCFVMGSVEDSIDGIFKALHEGALTMQRGGGVGYDFSTLRPRGSIAKSTGSIASGPVSFMRIWDAMCATLLSTGHRRGAMMATLRCDHPDILEFIDAKADRHALRHFNLSVLVTDEFMKAVEDDLPWELVFPVSGDSADSNILSQKKDYPSASNSTQPVTCTVYRTLPARELWQRIMQATYDYAEPGVLFIDRINQWNNLWYREQISATNPCGEIPLPPYGACDLGSINLTRFIVNPFTEQAEIDLDKLRGLVRVAVRMMDNVIDLSDFPLPEQATQARGSRRIGLGITGLGNALIMLGLDYRTTEATTWAGSVMATICHTAYQASTELAREKGAFPYLDTNQYLQGRFIATLPEDIRQSIAEHGIRNSHLIAIAPTGTISLLANNISPGLEPVFDVEYQRNILDEHGQPQSFNVTDYACQLWHSMHGEQALPASFVTSADLQPRHHLAMQSAIQPWVDNAISKTINIPADFAFEDFQSVYRDAYRAGLKGCTTFRPNPVTGAVLEGTQKNEAAARKNILNGPHCCTPERESGQ